MINITMDIPELDRATSEAYKSLRTNLKFCGKDRKVIMVTSCGENEGKSTVSLNLAISLAEDGERVLLMDCDLRKSVFLGTTHAKVISGPSDEIKGLAHILSGQVGPNDAITYEREKNLYVLFAGPTPPNPSELLGNKKFEILMNSLRDNFDYVIVDTPPLGIVIDGAVVARKADGAIMVVASGEDSYRIAQAVKEQIAVTGCPVLGAVLNKVDLKQNAGQYGQYYGKYYGKYYGNYGEQK